MKNYTTPEIELTYLSISDVISTSDVGTQTTTQDEHDGDWDLNIG